MANRQHSFYVSGPPPPEPSMMELLNLVRVADPYRLGVQLEIDEDELEMIRANHPNEHGRQLEDVFSRYLHQIEDPSWIGVVKALYAIGDIKCAKAVMKEFGILKTPKSVFSEKGEAGKLAPSFPIDNSNGQTSLFTFGRIGVVLIILICVLGYAGLNWQTLPSVLPPTPTPRPPSSSSTKSRHTTVSTKPSESPITEAAGKWLEEEPTIKLLSLISYTDSQGEKKRFSLINSIQDHCRTLGTELGIELARLNTLEKQYRDSSTDFCKAIFQDWKNRGEDNVTWGGLIKVLEDVELGGIGNKLKRELTMYYNHVSKDEL